MTNLHSKENNQPSFTIGKYEFYRPRPLALIISVVLIGICFVLGIWQLNRLAWKLDLIATVERVQKEAPMTNAGLLEANKAFPDIEFYPAQLNGEFDHTHEFHLVGQYYHGKLGYSVLTPLRLAGSDKMILVDRGWVPVEKKKPQDRPEDARYADETMVRGFFMLPRKTSLVLPKHDVKDNVWLWADIEAMKAATGLPLLPLVLETVEQNPAKGQLPIARTDSHVEFRNDHLSYAITWFSLTISGLVILALSHRKK